MNSELLNILKKCNIIIEDLKLLNGLIIPREILLSKDKFLEFDEEIKQIKKKFSSSRLTALQSTAKNNQRWPLLNLVRQLLKASNIRMVPKRICDGYDKTGKKKFKRFFVLEELKKVNKKNNEKEDIEIIS
tara:strand:+ start:66 stop:458 length:393 start_codon:yes stop_codon:yes gene_type:complete